jgi:thioredoxin 1
MAAPTPNITVLTHTTFQQFVCSRRYVVIHFWAAWNGYDVKMRKLIESQVPEELQARIQFATFDIDPPEHHDICQKHKVMGPPFLAYYRDGQLVQTAIGLQTRDTMIQNLRNLIEPPANPV